MSDVILIALTTVLLLPGFLGVILPVVPGIPYMFVVVLAMTFLTNFRLIDGQELAILGLIALVSIIVDIVSGVVGARLGGAATRSLVYGIAALIAGSFLLPPLGGIIAMLIAIFFCEWRAYKDSQKAFRSASLALLGALTGVIINFVIGIVFLLSFIFMVI